MRWIGCLVDCQLLPLVDVAVSDSSVVLRIHVLLSNGADGRHRFNADDPFQGQVGLVAVLSVKSCGISEEHSRHPSSKVISRQLLGRVQGVLNEI